VRTGHVAVARSTTRIKSETRPTMKEMRRRRKKNASGRDESAADVGANADRSPT
jgi:hypothetical protein